MKAYLSDRRCVTTAAAYIVSLSHNWTSCKYARGIWYEHDNKFVCSFWGGG